MKTHNGKTISKKYIHKILRTLDKTQIFRLYFQICGHVDRSDLFHFILTYAPSNRVRNAAYGIAYKTYNLQHSEDESRKYLEFIEANKYQRAVREFKNELRHFCTPYTKRPIMGEKYLYFASPVYGLADYNKWEVMPIEGNERFCETLCRLADKFFNQQ